MPKDKNTDCVTSRPYGLENTVQHYAWGTRDRQAYIAELLGIEPEAGQPFAELWMGVHPKAPSSIIDRERGLLPLSCWISASPEERLHSSGKHTALPYLFKVLSAGEALSIQAHPNKPQAEILHKNDPEHYPDDNHKPEIAIALDHLDALLGFITNEEYLNLLAAYPEIKTFIANGSEPAATLEDGIKQLFQSWERDESSITDTNRRIQQRLTATDHISETDHLFLKLFHSHGPEDVGLLFIFFMNRIHLEPGECVFLAPGVPHAYLNGNIIECMANSDNVVRLGLTNKFCDAKALQDILVYDATADYSIIPTKHGFVSNYHSPTQEFNVKSLELPTGGSELFSSRQSLSMFLIIEGEIGLHWEEMNKSCTCVFKQGQSFITPANLKDFQIRARHDSKLFFVEIPQGEG